ALLRVALETITWHLVSTCVTNLLQSFSFDGAGKRPGARGRAVRNRGALGGIQGGVTSHPSATAVLSVFVRAFRTPDLRKKLLFTGAMIVLFRFGSNLPAPGISEQNVSYCSR